MESLSPTWQAFCARHLGVLKSWTFCGWEHAESQVWRIEAQTRTAFLKCHRRAAKFEQEQNAYSVWLGDLPTPELIASHHDPNALLLSALPGELVQNLTLSEAQTLQIYEQAGDFLGRLHRLEVEDKETIALQDTVATRLESWLTKVSETVPRQDIEFVRNHMNEALPYLRDKRRLPCHRDYTARNWLLDGADFYVIDFEHAHMDFYLHDLGKQFAEIWRFHPELGEAFLAGYGHKLDDDARSYLIRVAAFNALTTIGWARAHKDKAFEAAGWEQFEHYRSVLG